MTRVFYKEISWILCLILKVIKSIQIDETFADESIDRGDKGFDLKKDMKIVTMSQLIRESSEDFEIDASKFNRDKK